MERYAIAALAAVLLTGVMAVPARAGTLIINGSFESGVPRDARGLSNHTIFGDLDMNGPGWDVWRVIDGWRTIRGPGIEVQIESRSRDRSMRRTAAATSNWTA